jgi:polyprenyl-phospho-N-acetylgalactosaminyl synthase
MTVPPMPPQRRQKRRVADHDGAPVNLGQGAALQPASSTLYANAPTSLMTFDVDGQHRVADIDVLIDAMAKHNMDFVFGSRVLGGAINIPSTRRLLLKAATWFTRITSGLSDTHNGSRAMYGRDRAAAEPNGTCFGISQPGLCQQAQILRGAVTIEYSAYSLAKGQKLGNSLSILGDLSARSLHR